MKRLYLALSFAIVAFVATVTATPPRQAATDAETAARADAYMSALHDSNRFNGALLMARNGRVILKKGYGMANFEWNIPNTSSTKFRVGSITKQFTSMAIMQLQERGLLNVQDPIGKYLTDYPKPVADRVTLHHLLTHSSGIPSYTNAPDYVARMGAKASVAQMIARFKDLPLEFEPGSAYKYNNSGYFLLGAIIEKVSGRSYETFLQDNIFGPLGMRNTGYDHAEAVLPNRASGYNRGADGLQNAAFVDMSQPYSAGALYSTVEDLLLWDQALYTEKLVKAPTLETIYKPRIETTDKRLYGYGWYVNPLNGHRNVGHSGSIDGFSGYLSRFPDDHAVFIWLRNVISPAPATINQDLGAILLGEKTK